LDTVPNGSGDTSFGWSLLWEGLILSIIACLIWTAFDWKRVSYTRLNYWLCVFTRYYLVTVAFGYGFQKVFALQMPFPSLHMLATPLGDLLPMRFSWLFIGFSKPYEIFSGLMEIFAGSLLLFRRTATLGAMVATGVFLNVMMLNLCYDIPVKIYSMQLTFVALFLLANESKRIIDFFILNKPAAANSLYQFNFNKKWQRWTRIGLKALFIIAVLLFPFQDTLNYYRSTQKPSAKQAIKNGVYEVSVYSVNNHVMPLALSDTSRWQDVIFENGLGSAKTSDTSFRQRYKRGYFAYYANDTTHVFTIKKSGADKIPIMRFKYQMPDSNTITLAGTHGKDSLYVALKRTKRHFQLAEKQFHWLSERNR
jgi:hypothetical protein